MKRCVIVSVKPSKDPKTGDDLLFIALYRLPGKMKNGGLWFPKPAECVINYCINKTHQPELYETFSKILPCTLADVTFALNEFNNKTYVSQVDIVKDTENIFEGSLLYV